MLQMFTVIQQGMQSMARRTIVRTTTQTLLLLGNSGHPSCLVCGGVMVTLGEGRLLGDMAMEQWNRWLESGAMHRSDLATLAQTVCLHSLLACLQNSTPA